MTERDEDRDLREVFQAARRAGQTETPPFARVTNWRRRRTARGPRLVWSLAGAAALLFAALGPLRAVLRTRSEVRMARQVMDWRSPTDFLLGSLIADSLLTIPAITRSPAGSALRALDPGGALAPPTQRSPL